MRNNPERLAWVILLLSFFTCVSLAVATPLSIRHYILYSCVEQDVTLEVQRPPLSVTLPRRDLPISVADRMDDIHEHTIIATDATAGRLVVHAPQVDSPVIVTVQLYDNTEVVLSSAHSPRFSVSHLPHSITLSVRKGRVRIGVSNSDDRPTIVQINTSHGTVTLADGSYEIKVNAKTEVTVRSGQADVSNDDLAVQLGPAERVIVNDGRIVGPQPAPRNLVTNGDFQAQLDGWTSYNKDIEIAGEPEGQVRPIKLDAQWAAVIEREGKGHDETGISQQLDADIHDFSFLQLYLSLRIEEQNVPVCGKDGSECPVMVRINYQDTYGADREWLQGFYSMLDTNTPGNQPVCTTCSTRNEHIRVPENTWYPYLSPNLIPLLSQDGQPPASITSITIYASGHTYRAAIAEVELIGQE